MIPIGIVCFTTTFVFDKCLSLRFYSSENAGRFDGQLALTAVQILPWAVVLHLVMGIWMLGAPDVSYSVSWPPGEGTVSTRVMKWFAGGMLICNGD